MHGAPTIPKRFLATAERVPDRPFLVAAYKGSLDRVSYAESAQRAGSFAHTLRRAGVQSGDRVILCVPNSLEFVWAYFGIWFAGGTPVLVDPRSRATHLMHVSRDSGARCVIVPRPRDDLDPVVRQLSLSDIDWTESSGPVPSYDNELALLIYTSGTTGTPKGVRLSHANLDHTRAALVTWAQMTEDGRELNPLSLSHSFGLGHLHAHASLGATMYVDEGIRDPPRLLGLIERDSITGFVATPTICKVLIDHFASLLVRKGQSLKYVVVGTAHMPVPYVEKLLSLLPSTRIYLAYGLTEASRSTFLAYREHPDKLATVGRPTPGAEVVVGSSTHPLVDEAGEILIRGPHVTAGYWGLESGQFFEDGWFRTGDLGSMDGSGFVTWLGRLREQINVSGLKLIPSEVEDVLLRDPGVKECAVVGAPDPSTGESVVAFVVPEGEPGQDFELRLRRLCDQHLEAYKVPTRVLVTDAIPKTDSGKVKRFVLRERMSSVS